MVDEQVRDDYTLLYADVLPPHGIRHIQSKVKVLNLHSATLETDKIIQFDICLIAVGASHPMLGVDPKATELSQRKTQLIAAGERYLNGDLIVIGGGLLGAEVAGEFSNSRHRITIVQETNDLVPEMRPNARRRTKQILERQGVNVITGYRAEQITDGEYKVGDSILTCDIDIRCTGYYSRNEFLGSGDIPQECRDKHGWIETNMYFQVNGCGGRVYAFGDCSNTGSKLAQTVFTNYKTVVHNMLTSLDCITKKQNEFKSYRPPLPLTILTLGPNEGVADLPFGVFEKIIPAFKNATLFIKYGKKFVQANHDNKHSNILLALAVVGVVAAVRIAMRE